MFPSDLAIAAVLLVVVAALLSLVVFGPKIRERDAQAMANRRRREIEEAKWRELECCADWRAERHRKSTEAR